LIRFSIYSDLEISNNSRNRKCEKETAKKQTAKKKKKAHEREMGQPTTSQSVNVPEKKTRRNSLMGRAQ
jgi:hypothetical protein